MAKPFENVISDVAHHWSYWQPDIPYENTIPSLPDGKPERRRAGHPRATISLADFDPNAKPFSLDDPTQDEALMARLRQELSAMQMAFAAEKRQKVLIIIQGTDASAPAEVVQELFDTVPANLHISRWRAPTAAERDRNYLWRFHQQTPASGEIAAFDRGYYSELLAPVVNQWITRVEMHQRIGHIKDFERMLSHTGTIILKFMLHVSASDHKERLQARWSDPEQCTTLNTTDFDIAQQWDAYQRAFETMLSATHTAWAPWTVVPAKCPKHRNIMMAAVVHQILRNLDN